MVAMTELLTERLIVLLYPSTFKGLKRLAKRNGRKMSGEARFAIAEYVEANRG